MATRFLMLSVPDGNSCHLRRALRYVVCKFSPQRVQEARAACAGGTGRVYRRHGPRVTLGLQVKWRVSTAPALRPPTRTPRPYQGFPLSCDPTAVLPNQVPRAHVPEQIRRLVENTLLSHGPHSHPGCGHQHRSFESAVGFSLIKVQRESSTVKENGSIPSRATFSLLLS